MNFYDNFTNIYPVTKTLRFELKPVAQTLLHIEKKGFIAQDTLRAEEYKLMKKILDEYHKKFIEEKLSAINKNASQYTPLLEDYTKLYNNQTKNETERKALKKIQEKIRKEIANNFEKSDMYKRLFKDFSKFIKEDLPLFLQSETFASSVLATTISPEKSTTIVENFKTFTTYFSGYNENRKNIYTGEEKSTAIAYRLIDQNLPKFIENSKIFAKLCTVINKEKLIELENNLKDDLMGFKINDFFAVSHYVNTLSQKQITLYNLVLGGKSLEGTIKIQGLNELINEYNQNPADKKSKIQKLKPLFKQILSDRETQSFIPQAFETDKEVLEKINEFYNHLEENLILTNKDGSLQNVLNTIEEYDLSKIYIPNDTSLTAISASVFGSWDAIQNGIKGRLQSELPQGKVSSEKYNEKIDKEFKSFKQFSLAEINLSMTHIENAQKVETYFAHLLEKTVSDTNDAVQNIFTRIQKSYEKLQKDEYCLTLISSTDERTFSKKLSQSKKSVEYIKNLLDALKELQCFIKPFDITFGDNVDASFYNEINHAYTILQEIIPLYNKTRNYLTKKPYSDEKIKLNFENSSFLNGWVPDYDTKAGLLFEKDGMYYLGINEKKLSVEEKMYITTDTQEECAKRIILDFQKPDNKNIPRLFIRSKGDNYAPAVAKYNLPIEKVIDLYDKGKFKTAYRAENREDFFISLHALIDYFKMGFLKHEDYKHFNFSWKETKDYNDISEFYHDVEISCYEVKTECINWNRLLEYIAQGKIYLFQIYNKDFSPYSKGTPNLHTLYWKALFCQENIKDVIYKLNGQAEFFFRKKSISWNEDIMEKGHHANELKEKFSYPIIKDRRYCFDKFHFHVPITMNFKSTARIDINTFTNQKLKEAKDVHIIGIDRGERHLLYITMINSKGEIILQESLNKIVNEHKGKTYLTNYHSLLGEKEKNRDEERKNWKTIETIKELKEGYLSQVIHKLTTLCIKNNAIIVMEDLNLGFMRGRQKIEKQVYQKFEKMLIDKLNFYVDKKKDVQEVGGLLNALQLTETYADFNKYKKRQCGCIFYIPAWNTSKIDPVTGFVNYFDTKYENIEKAKSFFNTFEKIIYNEKENYFEFYVDDYAKFNPKAQDTRTNWIICSNGERISTVKNKNSNNWVSKQIILTNEFKTLFKANDIDYKGDIKDQINAKNTKDFFVSLISLFRLTVQLRNSYSGTEIDYLISPVADINGAFYDSRTCNNSLPKDADANGAYNIARKGLWVLKQIHANENLKNISTNITNKEWLNFVQNHNY